MAVVSMTGFGRAEGTHASTRWAWEARSVNGRGLDVRVRLPQGFESLEAAARDHTQKRFKRGSIQLSLNLKRENGAAASAINFTLLDELLRASARYVGNEQVAKPTWDGLLSVRGVMSSEDNGEETPEARAELEAALTKGLAQALDALAAARNKEGDALGVLLNGLIDHIDALTREARSLAAAGPAAVTERIQTRLAALAPEVKIDPQRLAQEAALAALKADVREELDRLTAHATEAHALLAGGDAAGRRLDFLAMEFNREANTLCSKSADLALTRLGLDLKTAIDQLREQASNVE